MKVGLGSQGGVVDVADVMLRAHVRNEALTRVATTLAEDFHDFFTRHPLHQGRGQGWVCNIGLVGRTGIKIRRVNAFWIRAIVTVDSSIFKICDGTKHRREDVAIWEWKGIIDIVVTE